MTKIIVYTIIIVYSWEHWRYLKIAIISKIKSANKAAWLKVVLFIDRSNWSDYYVRLRIEKRRNIAARIILASSFKIIVMQHNNLIVVYESTRKNLSKNFKSLWDLSGIFIRIYNFDSSTPIL